MLSIAVVIPAYNEEKRLPQTLQALKHLNINDVEVSEVYVIDDGSIDGTSSVVRGFQKDWDSLKLVTLSKNRGKGAAVHEGMRQAKAPWILVADADMATPWEELEKLLAKMSLQSVIMGSRGLPESEIKIRQHWVRQGMGRIFNKILRVLNGLPYKDTQCGFKLVKNDLFFRESILPYLQVQRFAWDVEMILFFQKYQKAVIEVPIRWEHKEQSRVHLVRDSVEMFLAVMKLKWRLLFFKKSLGHQAR